MMVKYLLSNFSWDMVEGDVHVVKNDLTREEFEELRCDAIPIVGHPGIARIIGVPYHSEFITLEEGDTALIVGTDGGKLPYSAKCLPGHLSLKFKQVSIEAI